MLACVRPAKGGVFVDLLVSAGSREVGFGLDEASGRMRVWVREAAEGNRANRAVLKAVGEVLGSCELVSGASSRRKTVLVRGLSAEKAADLIKKLNIN